MHDIGESENNAGWFLEPRRLVQKNSSEFILLLLFLIIVTLLFTMITKLRSINNTYPPRAKLIETIMLDVTESHLWFEEILSGDKSESLDLVYSMLDRSKVGINTLLNGDKSIKALTSDSQIEMAIQAKSDLDDFYQTTLRRAKSIENAAAGSELDDIYDREYKSFIDTGRRLSVLISTDLNDQFKLFTRIQFFSVFMEIVSFSCAIFLMLRINGRRKESQSRLADANNQLELMIAERTSKLEKTIEDMERAQQKLVESEKMAALGSLVAGVAHEINTPIGNSYTASSYLSDKTKETIEKVQGKGITKSDFHHYLETTEKTSASLCINLERAAQLINSFKRIAVDQSNHEARRINVNNYMSEILLSLTNQLKKFTIQVNIDVDAELSFTTYPGEFSQIFTNLLQNSMKHAFLPSEQGVIDIKFQRSADEKLEISFSDNGKGVEISNLKRIFEPFYSTQKSSGGTGLGLSIVYSIVKSMQGSIEASSEPGKGLEFTILLPPVEDTFFNQT